MQDTATCSGMSDVCVDRIKMIFPNVGQCERCSNMDSLVNTNCVDRNGLGTSLMVEFTSNRETDMRGFEMLVNCADPGFDQNNIPSPLSDKRKRQVQEECTSPNGIGPIPFPELPPPVCFMLVGDCLIINHFPISCRLPESRQFWTKTIHHCT